MSGGGEDDGAGDSGEVTEEFHSPGSGGGGAAGSSAAGTAAAAATATAATPAAVAGGSQNGPPSANTRGGGGKNVQKTPPNKDKKNKAGVGVAEKEKKVREALEDVEEHLRGVAVRMADPEVGVEDVEAELEELAKAADSLDSVSVGTLPPAKRVSLTKELAARSAAVEMTVSLLEARKEAIRAGLASGGGKSPGGSKRVSRTAVRSGGGKSPTSADDRLRALASGRSSSTGGAGFGRSSFTRGSRSVSNSRSRQENPYVAEEKVEESFYLDLPFPWNALPEDTGARVGDVMRLAAVSLPKFNGERKSYIAWRNSFIPCVHLSDIQIRFKVMILRGSIALVNFRMRELYDSIVASPPGYEMVIRELERTYGGEEALLMARQEALLSLPELREGEYHIIETMYTRMSTFLLEWTGYAGGKLDETQSVAFFSILMGRVESSFSRKYFEWVTDNKAEEGLYSFQQWLGEQLAHHRRAERYRRRRFRGGERGSGGTATKAPERGGGVPPSSQERNFAHLGEMGWEEEEDPAEVALELGWEGAEEPQSSGVFVGRNTHTSAGPGRGEREKKPPCTLCAEDHGLGRCEKFKGMSPTERKGFLIKEGRCFLCFQKGHNVGRCRFTYQCAKCKGKHHTFIHDADQVVLQKTLFAQAEEEEDTEAATELLNYGMLAGGGSDVSLRTLAVWVENPLNGQGCWANAMLDDGCTAQALVGKELAEKLGLTGKTVLACTEGVGGTITSYRTILATIRVGAAEQMNKTALTAQVMENPAGNYQPVDWTVRKHKFPHLQGLSLTPPVPRRGVEVMLGNAAPHLLASLEEVAAQEGAPVARRTALGWTVAGPVEAEEARGLEDSVF